MNPVDEESGRVEGVDSFPDSEDANNNGGGPKSASAPVVETNFGNNSTKVRGGGIFSRLFHSDNTDTVENHLDDSQRSSFTPGKWKSLAGSRRIRFASHRSDINNDEMRGIVATPLDSDQCKPMAPGARLLKNIQTEVEDVPQFLRFGSFVDEEGGASSTQQTNQMYRLQATRGAKDVGCCRVSLMFRLVHILLCIKIVASVQFSSGCTFCAIPHHILTVTKMYIENPEVLECLYQLWCPDRIGH